MRAVRSGFQLRMRLGGNEERMIGISIISTILPSGGNAGEHHAVIAQRLSVIVVDLVAVSVALMDDFLANRGHKPGVLIQNTGVGAKRKGSADIFHTVLIGHQVDDRMCRLRIQLDAVGVGS